MNKTRFMPLGVCAVSIAALGIASCHKFAPRFVWNASASAPIGLYFVDRHRSPNIDDFVLVDPEPALERFITERGYLPPNIPLIKRVAALPGTEICRQSQAILVARIHVADALLVDSLGRKMPVWSGCFALKTDEVFLLNAHAKSLDGRYFGATNMKDIVGVAIPILVWDEHR